MSQHRPTIDTAGPSEGPSMGHREGRDPVQHMVESGRQSIPIQIDLNIRSVDTESETSDDHIDVALMNNSDDDIQQQQEIPVPYFNTLSKGYDAPVPGRSQFRHALVWDMQNSNSQMGMVFNDKAAVKNACTTYHLHNNKEYWVVESTTILFKAKCAHHCP